MKSMRRAIRRHNNERIRKKRFLQEKEWNWVSWMTDEMLWERATRRIHTTRLCSCVMCGNPRKYFKHKTLAEVRNDISYEEYLKEEV